jgi:hypothetical protein
MFGFRAGAEAGGLLSYGPDLNAEFRRCPVYVDKIIKGAKPSELPVEQTSIFVLTINLQTAKAPRLDDTSFAARPRRRGDRMTGTAAMQRCRLWVMA